MDRTGPLHATACPGSGSDDVAGEPFGRVVEHVPCATIVEAVGDGLIVFSPRGRVEHVNDRFCELTGYSREELVGALPPFPWWPEDQRERMRAALGDLVGGATLPRELPLQTASGERRVVRSTPGCVRDDDGRVVAHLVTFHDVTEQRETERALRASEARLSAVLASMAEGVVVQDASGEIVLANDAASRILGLTDDQLRGRTSLDPRWGAVHEDGSAFPGETHPAMVTLRTGQPVRETIMGIDNPAVSERRWIQINSDPFGPVDAEGRPSAAVATFTDVTELYRRNEEITRQRDFTDTVLGAIGEGLLVVDPAGRVALVNDRFCTLVGRPREEILGLEAPFPWWPPELADRFRGYLADPASGEGVPEALEILTAGGRRLPIEAARTTARLPGGPPGMVLVTIRDISRRQATERALAASEERYRTAAKATRDAIIIVGPDTRVRSCNPAACRILGMTEEELIGSEFGELGHTVVDEHGEEIPFPRRPLMATLATGRLQAPVTVGIDRPADGRRVWVIESCAPLGLLDELERPGAALVTLTDITHLRLAQEQLRASEERYRALFGYQADAVVRLSPAGRVLDASPSVWRVLRVDPARLPVTLTEHVHPEDRSRAAHGLEQMIAGAVGVRFLVRMRRSDDRWIWAEVTGGPVYDDDGALVEVQMSIRDVSDRVRLDQDNAALHRVSEIIAGGAPLEVILSRLAEEVGQALEMDVATVVRFDQEFGAVVGHWAVGAPEQPAARPHPIDLAEGHAAAAVVWRTGETATVTGAQVGADDPIGPVSALAVPVHSGGWPWGCLTVEPVHAEYLDECRRRLVRFADLAAVAIGASADRQRLHEQAETDPLTGLANRRTFMNRLDAEITRAQREGRPLSVILLDLDDFKAINDRHGHGTGDVALQRLADGIRLMARASDIVGRLGDDEFAWVLPGTPLATAAERARFLRDRIAGAPITSTGLTVTASFGVTHLTPADDRTALLERADVALFASKDLGRGQVQISD